MTEDRIESASTGANGTLKGGLGRVTGDARARLEGRFDDVRTKARDAYGRAIDRLETLSERAPADLRQPVRSGLDFARRKPLVTTGIIAALAFILAGSGRRRR